MTLLLNPRSSSKLGKKLQELQNKTKLKISQNKGNSLKTTFYKYWNNTLSAFEKGGNFYFNLNSGKDWAWDALCTNNNKKYPEFLTKNKTVHNVVKALDDCWVKVVKTPTEAITKWFDNINKEKLVIKSSNFNKNLHADFIFPEKESDVFVIVVHGYTSEPRGMGIYAKEYHNKGYNVLLPSLNGHGDSEANRITMGWHDRLDLIDWINFIVENYPESRIIIHGESMGSATTMMATGEDLPNNVKVAVADCGYTSVWDILSNKITNNFKLHEFPTLYSLNTANKIFAGFDFKKASAVEQIKKSKTPTIFIHGDQDKFVPYEMLDKVYEAASCVKEKVTIPDSPHARNACKNPELYWNSIFNFTSKYI